MPMKFTYYFQENKAKMILLLILLILMAGILIFVKYDYFLYSETIVKVMEVTETEYTAFNEDEPRYIQNVVAEVMNGDFKGETVAFENERLFSGLNGYVIREGDALFVSLDSNLTVTAVTGMKRDFLVVLMLLVFCLLLFLISSKQSLLIFLSTFINIGIFALVIYLRFRLWNIFLLFIVATVLFTVVTLPIIAGFNKKTLGAVLSTLLSVLMMMLLASAVIKGLENDLYFETIEFLSDLYDYKAVFYSSILISGLGAIMDTAIIMATAINELIAKNPAISTAELKHSAWEIAQDITGTIMNVLLFSCVVGAVPSIIYIAGNGVSMTFAIEYFASAEIIRALVGCIGIILAVPISYLVNIGLRRRRFS